MKSILALLLAGVLVLSACDSATNALAPTQEAELSTSAIAITSFWSQDFSTDADGWFDSTNGWHGTITVDGGTATFEGGATGPFSRFDGFRAVWPGDYIAEIDVYLDVDWAEDTGFDYDVASNGSDGLHQRDFIFHVGVVDGALLVNGSNNADFYTNSYKLLNDNGGDYFTVTTSGWYTLQHAFRDDAGVLAVDLNLLNADGDVLWTATLKGAADTIPAEVGGNRYAWFTHIDVAGGIEVDNHKLYQEVLLPDPATKDDCMKGGWQTFGFMNQGLCIQYVNTGKDSR